MMTTVRPLTQKLFDALILDVWPQGPAVRVDFGLDSDAHYEALHAGVRAGEITLEQLDEALGNGPKLTKLVRRAAANPHRDIEFKTAYDGLLDEDDDEDDDADDLDGDDEADDLDDDDLDDDDLDDFDDEDDD